MSKLVRLPETNRRFCSSKQALLWHINPGFFVQFGGRKMKFLTGRVAKVKDPSFSPLPGSMENARPAGAMTR